MPDTSRSYNPIARPFQRLAPCSVYGELTRRARLYVLASWVFLRLLGLVYVIAFGSLWLPLDGLIGREGIVPVAPLLAAAQNRLGIERWWQFPTLYWLDASDGFLYLLCGLGVGSGCPHHARPAPSPAPPGGVDPIPVRSRRCVNRGWRFSGTTCC